MKRIAILAALALVATGAIGCRSAAQTMSKIGAFVEDNVTGSAATGVASYDDVTRLRSDHDKEFGQVRTEIAAGDQAIRHDVDAQFKAFGDAQAKAIAEGKSQIEAIQAGVAAQVEASTARLKDSLETAKSLAASADGRASKAAADADAARNAPPPASGIITGVLSSLRGVLPPWADILITVGMGLLAKKHGGKVVAASRKPKPTAPAA